MSSFAITPGTKFDASLLYHIDGDQIHKHIRIDDIFKDKLSVVFGGPAPFSRLDTEQAELYEQFSGDMLKHVDQIVAIYPQDAFVCKKFKEEISSKTNSNNVVYYADGDAFFLRDYNIMLDLTFQGLCVRSDRWCGVIKDCEVIWVANDEYSCIDRTHPNMVLEWLQSQ